MRTFGRIAVTALVLASAFSATAALAQQRGGSAALRQGRLEEQFGLYRLDVMTAAWRDQTAPHRVRRAHRAAAMINGGDCVGARRLVAHDRLMAYRVGQACGDYEIEVSGPRTVDPDATGAENRRLTNTDERR